MRGPHSHFHVLATLAFVLACVSVGMTSALPVSLLIGDMISHSDTASSATASMDARDNHRRQNPAPIIQVNKFDYDEPDRIGKLNNEDVTLRPIGVAAESERPPTQLPARRYRVLNSNNVTLGILKHVNLNKADNDAVAAIRSEGRLLNKLDHNMFMWQRDIDDRTNHIWSYAVMYRAIRGQAYMGGGTSTEPKAITLKTLSAWQDEEDWDARIMLPVCERTALSKHKQLASDGIAIDDYSLSRWVCDRECRHWYPLNADPAYNYGQFFHKSYHRGARFLSDNEKKKYKANLPTALAPFFKQKKKNKE